MQQQTTIITGGSRGIGRAIAERLVSQGHPVCITATGEASFQGEPSAPDREHRVVELADPESVQAFISEIDEADGLGGCVCNAGTNIVGDILDYSPEDYATMMEVNLAGAARIAQAAARAMVRGGAGGAIVFISSIWAEKSRKGRAVYSATKAGMLGLMRGMALDVAEHGIRVNAVSPGFTETELTRRTNTPDQLRELAAAVPLKRLAECHEIAEMVAFLLSAKSSYVTGQNFVVDGGFSIG